MNINKYGEIKELVMHGSGYAVYKIINAHDNSIRYKGCYEIDGKIHESLYLRMTPEAAMIDAIANKTDNKEATSLICKMIDIECDYIGSEEG